MAHILVIRQAAEKNVPRAMMNIARESRRTSPRSFANDHKFSAGKFIINFLAENLSFINFVSDKIYKVINFVCDKTYNYKFFLKIYTL